MSSFEISVSLKVMDFDCTIDEISRVLNTEPTGTWLKGDPISPNSPSKNIENGWYLESRLGKQSLLEEHIADICSAIKTNIGGFKRVSEFSNLELCCCIYFSEEIPEIHISKDSLSFLASIHSEVDLDLIQM